MDISRQNEALSCDRKVDDCQDPRPPADNDCLNRRIKPDSGSHAKDCPSNSDRRRPALKAPSSTSSWHQLMQHGTAAAPPPPTAAAPGGADPLPVLSIPSPGGIGAWLGSVLNSGPRQLHPHGQGPAIAPALASAGAQRMGSCASAMSLDENWSVSAASLAAGNMFASLPMLSAASDTASGLDACSSPAAMDAPLGWQQQGLVSTFAPQALAEQERQEQQQQHQQGAQQQQPVQVPGQLQLQPPPPQPQQLQPPPPQPQQLQPPPPPPHRQLSDVELEALFEEAEGVVGLLVDGPGTLLGSGPCGPNAADLFGGPDGDELPLVGGNSFLAGEAAASTSAAVGGPSAPGRSGRGNGVQNVEQQHQQRPQQQQPQRQGLCHWQPPLAEQRHQPERHHVQQLQQPQPPHQRSPQQQVQQSLQQPPQLQQQPQVPQPSQLQKQHNWWQQQQQRPLVPPAPPASLSPQLPQPHHNAPHSLPLPQPAFQEHQQQQQLCWQAPMQSWQQQQQQQQPGLPPNNPTLPSGKDVPCAVASPPGAAPSPPKATQQQMHQQQQQMQMQQQQHSSRRPSQGSCVPASAEQRPVASVPIQALASTWAGPVTRRRSSAGGCGPAPCAITGAKRPSTGGVTPRGEAAGLQGAGAGVCEVAGISRGAPVARQRARRSSCGGTAAVPSASLAGLCGLMQAGAERHAGPVGPTMSSGGGGASSMLAMLALSPPASTMQGAAPSLGCTAAGVGLCSAGAMEGVEASSRALTAAPPADGAAPPAAGGVVPAIGGAVPAIGTAAAAAPAAASAAYAASAAAVAAATGAAARGPLSAAAAAARARGPGGYPGVKAPQRRRAPMLGKTRSRRATCINCGTHATPQWRCGPDGPRTLCNACGVRFKKGLPLRYLVEREEAAAAAAAVAAAEAAGQGACGAEAGEARNGGEGVAAPEADVVPEAATEAVIDLPGMEAAAAAAEGAEGAAKAAAQGSEATGDTEEVALGGAVAEPGADAAGAEVPATAQPAADAAASMPLAAAAPVMVSGEAPATVVVARQAPAMVAGGVSAGATSGAAAGTLGHDGAPGSAAKQVVGVGDGVAGMALDGLGAAGESELAVEEAGGSAEGAQQDDGDDAGMVCVDAAFGYRCSTTDDDAARREVVQIVTEQGLGGMGSMAE